jgi:putative ABC transport system substrate-binding protein
MLRPRTPIKLKLVDSLARPDGNATGLTDYDQDLSGKRLSLFKEAFPRMTRVALLLRANDQHNIDQYQTAASHSRLPGPIPVDLAVKS